MERKYIVDAVPSLLVRWMELADYEQGGEAFAWKAQQDKGDK